MKQVFGLIFGIVLVFCFQQYAFGADRLKIGLVDMQRFQEESIAFKEIRSRLKKRFDELQEKLNKEKNELKNIEEDLKKQSMMLSLDAKEDKRKELERKKRHYKYLVEEFTQEMKNAEREAIRNIEQEVGKVVKAIGKRDGYIMIIERRTVGLIYFDDAYDITDEVIKAYDRGQ